MTTHSSLDNLHVIVFGVGAIGTYVGGSLALAGNHVVFLERPEIIPELRQRGLHLRLMKQEMRLDSPHLAGSIEEILSLGSFDVAILAVKSYDTQYVLDELRPHSEALPPILCLQNGVDNEPAIETALGEGKVIAGSVTSAIGRRAAGDIVLERFRGIGVASGHPLSTTLVQALDRAGLNARLYSNAANMKWSKMFTNLIANATSAILDMSPGEIYAHPDLYELEIAQLRETLAIMRARGIHPVDLPATPVSWLAFIVRAFPWRVSHPLLKRVVSGGRGGKMPSFYIDLHSGHGKSEVDYLNGAVVRNGARLGIPTPANRLLNDTLLALTHGELELGFFARQPQKLIAAYCDLTTP